MSENNKVKSVLDGVPVKEGFVGEYRGSLTIVGHCPACGCPVYGRGCIQAAETPAVKRSCSCATAPWNGTFGNK